jgi:hypothetical protein
MKLTLLSPQNATSPGLPGIPAIHRRSPYSGRDDRLKHLIHIKHLAQEMNRPVQEVTPLYESVLRHLRATAKVKDFLAIFVAKKVKERLRKATIAGEHLERMY